MHPPCAVHRAVHDLQDSRGLATALMETSAASGADGSACSMDGKAGTERNAVSGPVADGSAILTLEWRLDSVCASSLPVLTPLLLLHCLACGNADCRTSCCS